MKTKRKIEIFSAGCPVCQDTIDLVNQIACPSCETIVLDMNEKNVAQRAKTLGINSVPAVVVDGELASCCTVSGPDVQRLKEMGLDQPLS